VSLAAFFVERFIHFISCLDKRVFVRGAYVGTVLFFFWLVSAFYVPGKGFSALIFFGDKTSERYLPEIKAQDIFIETDSHGYDAQYYAQIAVRPEIRDPELGAAVDNISYRARRILFSWTAWVLGMGSPERTLQIFALQGAFCWLGLAALLLRWFPPVSWENYLRWIAVLFCFGSWFSVRGALVDGPSLLLIAAGVALAESGRAWRAALVLGISGLAKETNILAAGALMETKDRSWSGWARTFLHGLAVLLPLAIWVGFLWRWFGGFDSAGSGNFALPLAGYFEKWRATLEQWNASPRPPYAYLSLLWLVTVTVQFLFLALRPRWHERWWRVGAAFAVLALMLGDSVWEGDPGAAGRVLLPMALAFNVLVPKGWKWCAIFVLGNLTIFGIGENLKPPGYQSYDINGPAALRMAKGSQAQVTVSFVSGWYPPERSRWEYWCWSKGSASIALVNPHPHALIAKVTFALRSKQPRQVTLREADRVLWSGMIDDTPTPVVLTDVRVGSGETLWQFETDREAKRPNDHDPRPVAFSVRNLGLELLAEDK
jgi:hypothetical protein